MRIIGPLIAFLACASCATHSNQIVTAIRDTGFVCEAVTSSEELGASGSHWRVWCADALTYVASFEPDGRICVSPVAYVEAPVRKIEAGEKWDGAPVRLPEFQRLPPDGAVVRCTPSSSG